MAVCSLSVTPCSVGLWRGCEVEVVLAAAVTTGLPIAYKIFRELKSIGHSVNGNLTARLDRIDTAHADLAAELRDARADVRGLKQDLRDHRAEHAGDGR